MGLPFSLASQDAGHDVELWQPKVEGKPPIIGRGLVPLAPLWEPRMKWADMIVMTDNSKYGAQIEPFFKKGFPIFGCNEQAAALELDREVGLQVLEQSGIECLPFKTFLLV